MIVVMDTNVLVSGLLKGYGNAGAILRLLVKGTVQIAYDGRVMTEYREVLKREKFNFSCRAVEDLLDLLSNDARGIHRIFPQHMRPGWHSSGDRFPLDHSISS